MKIAGGMQEADHGRAAPDVETVSQRLAENYHKEAELYRSVLKLTELQRANLEQEDDIRDFITLLHQKEDLIRAIDKIELRAEDDKASWLTIPDEQKKTCNEQLNSILDGIILLIEQVMTVERQNEELLRSRKDNVERQLDSVRRSCKAAKEYKTGPGAKAISAIS